MACCSELRGLVVPTKQGNAELLHEHQLRHHSIQVPPVNYDPAIYNAETLRLKAGFDYARGPAKQYIPCTGVHKDDVPDYCDWTVCDVEKWLQEIGYGRYKYTFACLNVDGKKLEELDAHELRRYGIRKWQDCLDLADAVSLLTGRTTKLSPEDYKHKLYPYHPAMYLGEQDPVFPLNQTLHHAADIGHDPARRAVYRNIYLDGGDRFYFFDTMRPTSLI